MASAGQSVEKTTEVIGTCKKHKKLLHDGKEYLFSYVRKGTGERVYRCAQQAKFRCKVIVSTKVSLDGSEVVSQILHQHEDECLVPDQAKCDAEKSKDALRKRTLDTTEPPRELIQTAMEGLSNAARVKMPSYYAMQREIEKRRRKKI